MTRYQPLAAALDQRRNTIQRVDELAGGLFFVSGTGIVAQPGEAVFAVKFPVQFSEKPITGFGAELGVASPVVIGAMPTISIMVRSWATKRMKDTGALFYLGASLLVVTTGQVNQTVEAHYQFFGRAVRPV